MRVYSFELIVMYTYVLSGLRRTPPACGHPLIPLAPLKGGRGGRFPQNSCIIALSVLEGWVILGRVINKVLGDTAFVEDCLISQAPEAKREDLDA